MWALKETFHKSCLLNNSLWVEYICIFKTLRFICRKVIFEQAFCRLREKGNLEATFFNIQARLKANGQKDYKPPEGMYIHDIESAWMRLEKAEHGREVALRDELIRQERLEQLAQRFRRKVKKETQCFLAYTIKI